MQAFKRTISVVLCCLLLLGCFCGTASAESFPFADISQSHQYYDAIKFVYENDIMYGTSVSEFSPDEKVTRAMFVTILYRIAGEPDMIAPEGFTDVPSNEYYYYPVGWAQAYGIVYGEEENLFNPDGFITREQAAAILYRYATEYEYMSYVLPDEDIAAGMANMEEYAEPAIAWMLNSGISNSTPNYFSPKSWLYRGLCSEYIWRFMTLAYGDGKAISQTDPSKGNADLICEYMIDMGYEAYYQYDLRPIAMEFAFYNSEIVLSNSHGGTNCIQMYGENVNNKFLYADDISYFDMANVDLVYISACQAGNEFVPALVEVGGADAAIGFTANVSASSIDNGIYKFTEVFFYYYKNGSTLDEALDRAEEYMDSYFSHSFGTDSVVLIEY